jgi:hypothetical protein
MVRRPVPTVGEFVARRLTLSIAGVHHRRIDGVFDDG